MATGATGADDAPTSRAGDALEQERRASRVGARDRQLLEVPVLALDHAHVTQLDHVHREAVRPVLLRGRERLVGVGVGERSGDVVAVQPLDRVHREARQPELVAERVAVAITRAVVPHLAGPQQDHIARLDGDAGRVARLVEVVAGDRVAGPHLVEPLDALESRQVDQHTAGDDVRQLLGAETGRARARGDHRRGGVVVEQPVVGDVAQRVDVGAGTGRHREDVVGTRPEAGGEGVALVQRRDRQERVDATRRLPDLDAVGAQVGGERHPSTRLHRVDAATGRGVGQQVAAAQFVVVTPASPVRDTRRQLDQFVGQAHRSGEGEHAAGELALVQLVEGGLEVLERVRRGDELVELQAT